MAILRRKELTKYFGVEKKEKWEEEEKKVCFGRRKFLCVEAENRVVSETEGKN